MGCGSLSKAVNPRFIEDRGHEVQTVPDILSNAATDVGQSSAESNGCRRVPPETVLEECLRHFALEAGIDETKARGLSAALGEAVNDVASKQRGARLNAEGASATELAIRPPFAVSSTFSMITETPCSSMPSSPTSPRRPGYQGIRSSSFVHKAFGRPKRIVFIRHAESEGNVDRVITQTVPDPDLHITAKGRHQALEAGRRLKELIGKESLTCVVSPYVRARETLNGILRSWVEAEEQPMPTVRCDIRIREQEYGNFDRDDIRQLHAEKRTFGAFYYRFPDGESPADCYDRASIFLESLYRSWDDNEDENLVIVSHGLMIIVTLMRLMRWPSEDFDCLQSPRYCEFVVLERPPDSPMYDIAFTWAAGEDRAYKGLRRRENAARPPVPIWDGDPDAELFCSSPVRARSLSQLVRSPISAESQVRNDLLPPSVLPGTCIH